MITRFTTYISEAKKSIDELEILTPDQLSRLLILAVCEEFPNLQHIQNLITVGCPIDAKDSAGWTALHYAACDGNIELMKFLISMGADINYKAYDGRNALHHAIGNKKLEAVKFILPIISDINASTKSGNTGLHWAAMYGGIDIVKFLISNGFDIHARNNQDKTPWDVADYEYRRDVPELNPNK